MDKYVYKGKSLEDLLSLAYEELKLTNDDILYNTYEEKSGLFSGKKTVIEIVKVEDIANLGKQLLENILKGFNVEGQIEKKIDDLYHLNDLQKKVSSLCNDSMEPVIRPDMLPIEYESKQLLAVKIDEISQNKKPCYYKPKGIKGGSYTRVGDSDSQMTDYEIYALQSYKDNIFEDGNLLQSSLKRLNNNSSYLCIKYLLNML